MHCPCSYGHYMLRASSWKRICRSVVLWINSAAVTGAVYKDIKNNPLVPSIQTAPQPESIFYSSQGSRLVFESKCLQLPFSLDNMERMKTILSFKLECEPTNPDTLVSATEIWRHHTHFSNNVIRAHVTYKWLIHSQLLICSPVWNTLDWKLTSALVPHCPLTAWECKKNPTFSLCFTGSRSIQHCVVPLFIRNVFIALFLIMVSSVEV